MSICERSLHGSTLSCSYRGCCRGLSLPRYLGSLSCWTGCVVELAGVPHRLRQHVAQLLARVAGARRSGRPLVLAENEFCSKKNLFLPESRPALRVSWQTRPKVSHVSADFHGIHHEEYRQHASGNPRHPGRCARDAPNGEARPDAAPRLGHPCESSRLHSQFADTLGICLGDSCRRFDIMRLARRSA